MEANLSTTHRADATRRPIAVIICAVAIVLTSLCLSGYSDRLSPKSAQSRMQSDSRINHSIGRVHRTAKRASNDLEHVPLGELVTGLTRDDENSRSELRKELHRRSGWIFAFPDLLSEDDVLENLDRFRVELQAYLPELRRLLSTDDVETRNTAILLLANIGPAAGATIPVLQEFLRSKELPNEVRMNALIALLHVTPLEQAVVPMLMEVCVEQGGLIANSPDGVSDDVEKASSGITAVYAALLLAGSGRTAIEVPSLIDFTDRKFRQAVRLTALLTIINLKEEAQSAILALRKLLTDEDPLIRQNAGLAILEIQQSTDEMPAILDSLQMSDKDIAEFHQVVAQSARERMSELAFIRESAEELVPICVRRLKHANPFLQRSAIRTLGHIGAASRQAIPELLVAAKSTTMLTRIEALKALEQIDPKSIPADLR